MDMLSQREQHAEAARQHAAEREELCAELTFLQLQAKSSAEQVHAKENHLLRSMQLVGSHGGGSASEVALDVADAALLQHQLTELLVFGTERFQVCFLPVLTPPATTSVAKQARLCFESSICWTPGKSMFCDDGPCCRMRDGVLKETKGR